MNASRRKFRDPCKWLRLAVIAPWFVVLVPSLGRAAVPLTPAGNGHLVVPTFVNGKGTVPFILDTGADGSGVYDWFAQQQGLVRGPDQEVEGMTGTVTTPTYALDGLAIDGRALEHTTVDSYPDRKDAAITAGVAGNDLMAGAITVFDFPCRTVTILAKPVRLGALLTGHARMVRGVRVRSGTQLTFPVDIGGVRGVAVLDTGSRDTRINGHFASAAAVDTNGAGFSDSDVIYGANSKAMESRKGPVGTIGFAGLHAKGAQVRVMDLPVLNTFGIGDGPAMIFGLDLMQPFRLVYDFDDRRFWFDVSHCQRMPLRNRT